MRSGLVIVRKIRSQNSAQRALVEHDHMVQALPPYGTNYAFDVGPLTRGPGSREHFPDCHVSDLLAEVVTENLVAVTQQIPRDAIERKRLTQLLRRPFRRRMSGHIEVDHTASFMGQHQKHVQHLKADGWHGEKVHRDHSLAVIVEEGTPGL